MFEGSCFSAPTGPHPSFEQVMENYQLELELKKQRFIDSLDKEPPVPCEHQVGDEVIYVNPNGVQFLLTISGFSKDLLEYDMFIHLFDDAYWSPVSPERITPAGKFSPANFDGGT